MDRSAQTSCETVRAVQVKHGPRPVTRTSGSKRKNAICPGDDDVVFALWQPAQLRAAFLHFVRSADTREPSSSCILLSFVAFLFDDDCAYSRV